MKIFRTIQYWYYIKMCGFFYNISGKTRRLGEIYCDKHWEINEKYDIVPIKTYHIKIQNNKIINGES